MSNDAIDTTTDVVLVVAGAIWALPPSKTYIIEHPFITLMSVGSSIWLTKLCGDIVACQIPEKGKILIPIVVGFSAAAYAYKWYKTPNAFHA